MVLGDLGAAVIKVERPEEGDETRQWGPPWVEGRDGRESAYFLAANRNKRSVTADLGAPEGQALVHRLAARADVAIENFAPGTLERWGLGYEALAAVNPGLVFCSITGYGGDGPEAGRPGYDFAVQARAGWMAVTGEPAGPPMKTGVAWVDVLTGQNAAIAILAALAERSRSGQGQRIEVALFDSALSGLINVAQAALVTGREPARHGNAHPTIVPYEAFAAADRPFVLAVGNDAQWQRLCAALERPDLAAEPRFSTNPRRVEARAELSALLAGIFATGDAAVWLARLDAAGVPCAPVQSVGEALADPVLRDRAGLWEMEGSTFGRVATVASPLRLSRTPARLARPAPGLGEHQEEIERDGWG
jgi:crotonobetainyl-CoA:carnitine CoA-transferase CaiB-like acyl-CoA transferase